MQQCLKFPPLMGVFLRFLLQATPFCLAAPVDGDDTPGLGLAGADWKGLRVAVRVGNTIASVRACALKVAGDDVEEYVYPLQYSGRTDVEAQAKFRKIRGALGFGAQASGHPPFIDAAQLAALPADSWAYVKLGPHVHLRSAGPDRRVVLVDFLASPKRERRGYAVALRFAGWLAVKEKLMVRLAVGGDNVAERTGYTSSGRRWAVSWAKNAEARL